MNIAFKKALFIVLLFAMNCMQGCSSSENTSNTSCVTCNKTVSKKQIDLYWKAVKSGDGILVEKLIKEGVDINLLNDESSAFHDSALADAAGRGHLDIVELLLNKGADPNIGEPTPLYWAAHDGYLNIVKLLIKRGAKVKSKEGGDALFAASGSDEKLAIAKILIENGADLDHFGKEGLPLLGSPLMRAVYEGQAEMVKLLLNSGANINAAGKDGETCLFSAVSRHNSAMAKWLIQQGAKVNLKNSNGFTPIVFAVVDEDLALVKLLEDNGATIDDIDLQLAVAIMRKNRQTVDALLAKNAKADLKKLGEYNVVSPMIMAAKRGDVEILQKLLSHGADPNVVIDAETPLTIAAENGYIDAVRFLLKIGADVNVNAHQGSACRTSCYYATPLAYATMNDHFEIVNILIDNGADINAMAYDDTEGNSGTPLMYAAESGYRKIVKVLLGKGADVNATDYAGGSALFLASAKGHVDIVRDLLNKGANVNETGWEGTSIIEIAKEKGHAEVVKVLQKASAKEKIE